MKKLILFIALLGICFSSILPLSKSFSFSQSQNETKTLNLDEFIESNRKKLHIPALTIGIVQNDKIIYLKGFGTDAKTPFILGSVSKSFTALAIKQLEEKGKISLDAPVQQYIPEFRVQDKEASSHLTVRDLLYHRSGFSTELGNKTYDNIDLQHPLIDYVKKLQNIKLKHPIGKVYEYSNVNYVILGAIIEKMSGMTYGEYIQKNIFEPLNMKNSYTNIELAQKYGLIQGYQHLYGLITPYNYSEKTAVPLKPAGFLVSNSEDMTHYLLFQINGNYNNTTLLSAQNLKDMHQRGVSIGPSVSYGMGLLISKIGNTPAFGHNGDVGNFHSEMIIIPKANIGIVLLSNLGGFENSPDFQKFFIQLVQKILSQTDF